MADVTVWWSQTAGEDDLARELLTRAVAEHLECAPARVEMARLCPSCGSHLHGRPVVVLPRGSHPHLSLSRAPGVVAVALTEAGPLGVDVEEIARTAFAGFAQVALHLDERADTPLERGRVWTRKEAVLKAAGTGLHLDPRHVRVSAPSERARLEVSPEGFVAEAVWIEDLDVPPAYAAAVAVVSATAPRLRVRQVATAASAAPASGAAGRAAGARRRAGRAR